VRRRRSAGARRRPALATLTAVLWILAACGSAGSGGAAATSVGTGAATATTPAGAPVDTNATATRTVPPAPTPPRQASPTPGTPGAPSSPAASTPAPTAVATATTGAAGAGATASPGGDNTWTDATSPTAIPLGDGRVSTAPRVGYVDSCTTAFRGGGAEHAGPWIDASTGTWNEQAKIAVRGERRWPNASYQVAVQGTSRVIATNDLPAALPTGTFPIAATDPAYVYDRNPNSIVAQSLTYSLPADPTAAPAPTCTGLGPIGVTTDGVLLFNALDAAGRDAGAHEVQDACDGHPDGQQRYHYHSISDCLESPQPNTSMLVGYAFDGYGIYAEWNAAGALPTNADLDACHGRTSRVTWDGTATTIYHYDVTLEYPYTVGCFHGTPIRTEPGPP
jgi:YHYH protein